MAVAGPLRLESHNSRARVELWLPRAVCAPGDTLRVAVHLDHDGHYTSSSLRLYAYTRATIMGKDRWQAGAVMNATLGGGGMGAAGVPVTTVETLPFLDLEIPCTSAGTAAQADPKRPEKQANDVDPAVTPPSQSSRIYEFELPHPQDAQILPSLAARQFDMTAVSVLWTLKFEGVRKGLLRRNDSLTIELPVVFPTPPPSLLPSTASLVRPFKFDSGSNEGMSLQADLSLDALSHRAPLQFTLSLVPSSASASHLLTTGPNALKITASISRQTRTTPILNPSSGRSFEWAGVRVVQTDMTRAKDDDWKWYGSIELPDGDCSVESKGIALKYLLNCHVISPVLAQAALHISIPVFIPSTPFPPASPDQEPSTSTTGDSLPAYSAS
ncbi:uncharacterized protein JCM15063_000740 [Sporobolomyces koalae]|uniref:uncharacterized protein n=1 Tax=Sporobolomyces koalae TaxID=500713 RepID=UPI003178CDD5